MKADANDSPKRLHPSTMDAWAMLCVASGIYVVSQLLLTEVSILAGTAAGQVLSFLVPSLLYAKWKSGAVKEALRLRPVAGGILWRVVLLALTFVGVGDLIQQATHPVIARYLADFIPALEAIMEILTPKSAAGLVGNLVVVGLLVPVCEEALFRGAFQGTLEQRRPVRAILASTLAFAFVHLNPFDVLGIVLIGIALGYVTWRTQSLWPAILWHVVNNSAATLALRFGDECFSMPMWLDAVLLAVFVGLAWEFVRHTRREVDAQPGPLATAPAFLGRKSGRLVMAGGLAVVVLLMAGATCFGRARLGTDLFQPDFSRGDIVIYTRGPALRPGKLQSRDAVIYRQTSGGLRFSRILATDDEQITVIGQAAKSGHRPDAVVAREDIVGKVVWKYDPGEEVKRLTRQIDAKRKTTPQGITR